MLSLWLPVALWAAVIFILSGDSFSADHTGDWLFILLGHVFPDTDAPTLETIHAIVRKTAHAVEYAVLGFLAYRAFRETWRPRPDALWVSAAVLLALTVAACDETHQAILASRTGSPFDVLLDTSGAVLGIWLRLAMARQAEPRVAVASRR